MSKLPLIITFSLTLSICAKGQNAIVGNDIQWDDFINMIDEPDIDGTQLDEEWLSELYYIHNNPYDINKVKAEELMELPLLSAEKAEDIIKYVKKNGPVMSLGELMMVESLNENDRKILRMFLCVSNKRESYSDMIKKLKKGKHELVWKSDLPLYTKAGFKHVDKEILEKNPNKIYLGDRLHHALKYAFNCSSHLRIGLQMEKDAGETGVDYKTGYVMIKDIGIVKEAVAGNFKVSYGKGLVTNTSVKFGKSMMSGNIDRIDAGVDKYSGMSEWGYFSGGAMTIRLGDWELSVYGSSRNVDATFRKDSTGISAFKTDGMHRTYLERSKKGNVHVNDMGANIHWGKENFMLSASMATTHIDTPLLPTYGTQASAYRKFQARGKDFAVGSIAYLYKSHKLAFSGETAYSSTQYQNGTASLNCLRWDVNDANSLSFIWRYYGAQFISINGKAFGENSAVQNEEGLFVSWTSKAAKRLQLYMHTDIMYFPWLKYGVSGSSYAYEYATQATYSQSKRTLFSFKYKMKAKQKDIQIVQGSSGNKITAIGWSTSHSAKLTANADLSPSWTLRANASAVLIATDTKPSEKGFALGSNIRWKQASGKAWADTGLTCFITDSYNARVYGYETSTPYSFGYTSYFYKGLRCTLTACVPIIKRSLTLYTKFGSTIYFDREAIGSALDKIDSTHKEDLLLQAKWQF